MGSEVAATKRRLLLINPYQRYKHYATQPEMCRLMGKRSTISPLALTIVAALTPSHYEIRIVDEELEPLHDSIDADIVGITALTNTIERCYEIADRFRAQGRTVVLGGPYASFAVEEALEHADSVVVGEAEGAWEALLRDFERGCLQQQYRADIPPAFTRSPIPRWDLVDTSKVVCIPVEISRGCPYDCEFCVVTKMFGRTMRYRAIDDVVAEIESLPLRTLLFVDDNLTVSKRYARDLMQRLKPLGISWTCQASLDLAKDPELLHEMADAGCEHIIIGFESMNPESLEHTRKYHNRVAEYQEAIDTIHDCGIMTFGSFVVGFDTDTLEEFGRIVSFAQQAPVPYLMLNLLVPSPGTDLQKRLRDEGRWLAADTNFSGGMFPVIRYMRLGHRELLNAYLEEVERVYSFAYIRERILRLFRRGAFTRQRAANDLKPLYKVLMLLKITWLYTITRTPYKRRFFFEVLALVAQRRVSIDRVVGTLATMEGFHRHVRLLHEYADAFRPWLEANDEGPWAEASPQAEALRT